MLFTFTMTASARTEENLLTKRLWLILHSHEQNTHTLLIIITNIIEIKLIKYKVHAMSNYALLNYIRT